MTRKFTLLGAFASLAIGPGCRAEELAQPPAPPNGPTLTSKIRCNGNLSVPMTSDQEQALPLNVIAALACGQEVKVLSDRGGYTVNISTEDGKSGYVAWMYLTRPTPRPTLKRTEAPAPPEEALVKDGVARWQTGAKGSDQFLNGDKLVESLTANRITVQVSLQDTGWKMRANVAVVNARQQAIYVLPKLLTLMEVAPGVRLLRYEDPVEMAKAVNHQILWTSASASPDGITPSKRSSSLAPSASTYSVGYQLAGSAPSLNLLAQQQAREELAAKNQAALVNMVREIKALSLRECILNPNEKIAGAVWFERDAKSQQLLLRVPVGGVIFEFPLSFHREK